MIFAHHCLGLGGAVSLYPRDDTEVTLKSNIDDIEEALMNVLQAILKYNTEQKYHRNCGVQRRRRVKEPLYCELEFPQGRVP